MLSLLALKKGSGASMHHFRILSFNKTKFFCFFISKKKYFLPSEVLRLVPGQSRKLVEIEPLRPGIY